MPYDGDFQRVAGEDLDPDNDGSNEWIETHIYFHFKDNKAVYYQKEVCKDEGDVQGEFYKDLCDMTQRELSTEMEAIHNDFEVKIIDNVIHITGSEGTEAIYYNVNEMYMMYEDDGIGKTTLKKATGI